VLKLSSNLIGVAYKGDAKQKAYHKTPHSFVVVVVVAVIYILQIFWCKHIVE